MLGLLACIPYKVPFFGDSADPACAVPRVEDIGCAVDGDTFDIGSCGSGERVRLLGVDTPEVFTDGPESCTAEEFYDPETETCCYGTEASDYLKELMRDRDLRVRLEFDKDCEDEYGRILAYAWLLPPERDDTASEPEFDELFLNEELLREGYARVYDYDTSIRYYQDFVAYQTEAVEAGRGLWGACYE